MIWFERVPSTVNANLRAAPATVHISIYCKSSIDEYTAVLLHAGDDEKVLRNCALDDGPDRPKTRRS